MSLIVHTKGIGWAYPSSPNAAKFGYEKTGCWCVQIYGTQGATIRTEGYASLSMAVDQASLFPEPWDKLFLCCISDKVLKAFALTGDEREKECR